LFAAARDRYAVYPEKYKILVMRQAAEPEQIEYLTDLVSAALVWGLKMR
jgi:hypothetical protein